MYPLDLMEFIVCISTDVATYLRCLRNDGGGAGGKREALEVNDT